MSVQDAIRQAAAAIDHADALLIGAGAGMGVDSGLPDFRGDEGFWRAYPPFRKLGLSFVDLANPIWFQRDPDRAWGFYGHRLELYRRTEPHLGFRCLLELAQRRPLQYFVFTSNVDGHFHASGFDPDRIVECHGSIAHWQCSVACGDMIWNADQTGVAFDPETFRATPPLPHCPRCGVVARPNILMFGDASWIPERTDRQYQRYRQWLERLTPGCKLVGIELGAGTAVPTVRYELEQRIRRFDGTLIRINPREGDVAEGISIPAGASATLQKISEQIS